MTDEPKPTMIWPDYLSRGNQPVCIEKRGADGSLDFSDPQPPVNCKSRELFDLFFRENPQAGSAAPDAFFAWLRGKGWTVRAKTW